MPTWLRELQQEVSDERPGSAGAAAAPDWLLDPAPPAAPSAPAAAPPPAAPALPLGGTSWLDSLGRDQPPPPAAPPAPPAAQNDEQLSTNSRIKMPVGATDWLRSMGHDPDASSEPLSEPISTPEESSGVPDWLRDLSDADVAQAFEEQVPDSQARFDPQAPGWLTDERPNLDESTVSANWQGKLAGEKLAEEVPDWLHEATEADDGKAQASPAEAPPDLAGSVEVPAWLRELGSDEPPAPDEQRPSDDEPAWLRDAAASSPPDDFVTPDEVEVPSWLHDAAEPASAAQAAGPAAGAPASEADSMPAWLRDAGPSAGTPPPAAPASESDSVPAWLRDAGPSAGTPPPPPAAPASEADSMPAWLRDVGQSAGAPPAAASESDSMPAWLRDAGPSAGIPPAPSPAAPDSDSMPAWLRDAGPSAGAPPAPPAAASESDSMPAWLRDAGPSAGTPPPAAPASESDSVPAWLRDAGAPPAPPPAAAESDSMPAWLRDAGPSAGTPPPPAPAESDSMPAWLRDAGPSAGTPPAPPAAPESDSVPAWLRDVGPSAGTPPPPAPGADAVPEWLREAESPQGQRDASPDWLREEPAAPNADWLRDPNEGAALPPPAQVDMPAWLQGEPPAPAPALPAAAQPAPDDPSALPPWLSADDEPALAAPTGPSVEPALPPWLRGVADEPPPVAAPAPPAPPRRQTPMGEQTESNSFLSGADLPSWLRVPEPERPADSGEGQALDWLRRLGGAEQEEEPLAAGATPMVVPQRPEYQRTAEQLAAINLLKRLNSMPYPQPVVPVAPAPLTRWQQIGLDRVLYAILTLALLIALLAPIITTPFQSPMPVAPGAAELGALLDRLDAEDVVLVAYEWGAQRSSELRPLETAVTRRLIAKKSKLILVSTDLQGTLLSFDLVGPLREAGYNNEGGANLGGRDYVLLGYRPGGELALRSLAQDLRGALRSDFYGQDATKSLVANHADETPRFTGINDVSMILVIADQPQDVQAWMEQVRPMARDVPMVFLLPQETQPLVQPFLRLPNVYHLAGQQGALALAAGSADASAAARTSGQLWYAVTLFLVLLIGGAVANAVSRRRAAQAAQGGAA